MNNYKTLFEQDVIDFKSGKSCIVTLMYTEDTFVVRVLRNSIAGTEMGGSMHVIIFQKAIPRYEKKRGVAKFIPNSVIEALSVFDTRVRIITSGASEDL